MDKDQINEINEIIKRNNEMVAKTRGKEDRSLISDAEIKRKIKEEKIKVTCDRKIPKGKVGLRNINDVIKGDYYTIFGEVVNGTKKSVSGAEVVCTFWENGKIVGRETSSDLRFHQIKPKEYASFSVEIYDQEFDEYQLSLVVFLR